MHPFVCTTILKRLFALASVAGLAACATAPVPSGTDTAMSGNLTAGGKFNVAVGQPAASLQDLLWSEGYGFEGAVACTASAMTGCQPSDQILSFQPVEIGRKGHVYFKVVDGRVAQIAWDFKYVPYLDN
jgi:hypothetical protein